MIGIKVSVPGAPADSTVPEDISLDTEHNLLKVFKSGKVTLSNNTSTSISHDLGYIPIYWVFVKRGNNLETIYYPLDDTYAYTNDENLVIYNLDGASRDFYYYIFYDEV